MITAKEKIQNLSTYDKNYKFDEEVFKNKYNNALELIKEGVYPKKIKSPNLGETDFVVLPLEKTVYGIDYFVLLPIEKRGLTGEEMLVLASKMQEVPIEQILAANSAKEEKYQNRQYTFFEKILEKKIMSEYFYLGKKPMEELGYDINKKGPLGFGATGEFGVPVYWIYPVEELGEEQMIQVIDKKYRNMNEKIFNPTDKELSYNQSIEIANEKVKEFKITAKNVENYYPLYNRGSLAEDYQGLWLIMLETDDKQYIQLELNALDGKLNRWILLENSNIKKTMVKI